jgi:hypothetical protein
VHPKEGNYIVIGLEIKAKRKETKKSTREVAGGKALNLSSVK